jgi:Zn-dependent peptidase ImmA (M78 family)/DNA-binding XRE family transcriptional regulator
MAPTAAGRTSAADAAALFDGRRLAMARHLHGLRKNALAGRIGKTPTAVAGYESGTKRPSVATVAALAVALGVEPAFFLPSLSTLPVDARLAHFRSLRSTTQTVRDQAYAYALAAAEAAALLETYVELPALDLPSVPVCPDDPDREAPARAARELRTAWGWPHGPAPHLIRAAENHGIVVVYSPPAAASVDAYSVQGPLRPIILLNPVKDDYWRQRYDVAHEIGHLVMHSDAEPGGKAVEEQADHFAAALLMPAAEIVHKLPARADWRRLGVLKEEWGASMAALLYRARDLRVMREVTYRNALSTMSARGWRRAEPGPRRTLEQPSMLARAVELLADAGIDTDDLACQVRLPADLFRSVTARRPAGPV